jgi:hypothetical protein
MKSNIFAVSQHLGLKMNRVTHYMYAYIDRAIKKKRNFVGHFSKGWKRLEALKSIFSFTKAQFSNIFMTR